MSAAPAEPQADLRRLNRKAPVPTCRRRTRQAWCADTVGWLSMFVVVLALHGCASTPSGAPGPAPSPGAARGNPLEVERQWLQSWFKGTPVQIAQRDDASLGVEVPREFCFDSGRSVVKPALAAVLDKVAESLRRNPQVRLQWVAAPGDGGDDQALARQRATTVRTHLRSRGVPDARLGNPTATTAAAVQLRLQFTAH